MKQHITPDQLAELSDKQKDNLVSWCFKNDYFTRIPVPGEAARFTDLKKGISLVIDAPLLSIGQMIDFLDEYGNVWCKSSGDVELDRFIGSTAPYIHVFEDELVDALWEAVKEVLREGE